MTIKKNYLKSKNICRVTFSLPANDAQQAAVAGDFNAWRMDATLMKKGKQGFSATVDLEPGNDYQFRYVIDGERWENDDNADNFSDTPFGDARNSVIRV